MVNRILIRIKVVQIVYSYFLKGTKDLNAAEKELLFSLEKSYDLYHYLLLLMIELTDAQAKRLDIAKVKHLATYEEKSPNIRFVNNRFIAQLKENQQLNNYNSQKKISWINEQELIKTLLEAVLESEIYKQYMESADDSYISDREFWKKIFKNIITVHPALIDVLEDQSLYWNDDLDIISTFVLKSIKRFDESAQHKQPLLPMFKDDEDSEFARKLFRKAILDADNYKELINQNTKNWEIERVAQMDVIIMCVALSEIFSFPSIPLKVSLNEYIEIAKTYSTHKSGNFINGILDSVITQLKKEGVLSKD